MRCAACEALGRFVSRYMSYISCSGSLDIPATMGLNAAIVPRNDKPMSKLLVVCLEKHFSTCEQGNMLDDC
jgi:hypothetical protein